MKFSVYLSYGFSIVIAMSVLSAFVFAQVDFSNELDELNSNNRNVETSSSSIRNLSDDLSAANQKSRNINEKKLQNLRNKC